LDSSWGQWWRVHWVDRGAWFFATDDPSSRSLESIGRFDLPDPHGTCYVSDEPVTGLAEHVREGGVTPAESQKAINKRSLSQMPLDRWYGRKIADMTSGIPLDSANPVDVTTIGRHAARPWALAAHHGGFGGLLYKLNEDPKQRRGLALFWKAGEHKPSNCVAPQPIVVGARRELGDLLGYRGDDPLAV
jgi:hypothetical protein